MLFRSGDVRKESEMNEREEGRREKEKDEERRGMKEEFGQASII